MDIYGGITAIFNPLCSRKGKALLADTIREGKSVGLEYPDSSRNNKISQACQTTHNTPEMSPRHSKTEIKKLTRPKARRQRSKYPFTVLSREQRDNLLTFHDKKPGVGKYYPKPEIIEKNVHKAFLDTRTEKDCNKTIKPDKNLSPLCHHILYFSVRRA